MTTSKLQHAPEATYSDATAESSVRRLPAEQQAA